MATVPRTESPADALRRAHGTGILTRKRWGDGVEAVCMMSVFVPGAKSVDDCVTAGWPEWLAQLVLELYDNDVGAEDELEAAYEWALRMAEAIVVPVDYEQARRRFLIGTLESIPEEDKTRVVRAVIRLHRRALAGEAPTTHEGGIADFRFGDIPWATVRDISRSFGQSDAYAAGRQWLVDALEASRPEVAT